MFAHTKPRMGVSVKQVPLLATQPPSLLWFLQLEHMASKIVPNVVRSTEDHVCVMFPEAITGNTHFIFVHILLAITQSYVLA